MSPADTLRELAFLLVAIAMLWRGADALVVSAARIARRFGLSDLVIGMTVVALGTSAPEMLVTLVAALRDQPDISVGNVVGSNIFNTGIILGGCAAIWGLGTGRALCRRDLPALLAAVLLLTFYLRDLRLGPVEGATMALGLVVYIVALIRSREPPVVDPDEVPAGSASSRDVVLLGIGLGAVLLGAHLLVSSSVSVARAFGISEWAIGVTIVAGGTSLPELATAFAAARRGHSAMMAGSLVGSDLFNVLGVLGIAAMLNPLVIDDSAVASIYMMTAMITALWLFSWTGFRVTRSEGLLLVAFALLRWARDLGPG